MSASGGRFRVAIAGCHRMLTRTPQSHNWAAVFDAVTETDIVAVFDKGAETRAAFLECWGDMPAYDDYQRMLQEIQPDIVCIATRQTMHAEQCEQAVEAGVRGILFEKPLATSMAEVDHMVAACQRGGVPVALGVNRRWWGSYGHLRRLIRDGAVGEVQAVVGYGLPNMINHGCHWYDVMLGLVGDPTPVWASGHVEDVSGDPPDSRRRLDPPGRGMFGFGKRGVGYATPDGGPAPSFEVLGDRGRLVILNDAADVHLLEPAEGATPWGGTGLRPRPLAIPGQPTGQAGTDTAVHDLVRAIETGGTTACDVDRASSVTELGFAFHVSDRAGGARIPLPLEDRTLRIASFAWGNE